MTGWDERFHEGQYPRDSDPPTILQRFVEAFPEGHALDVATGTGRCSVFPRKSGEATQEHPHQSVFEE